MRAALLFLIPFLFSCASGPERTIASNSPIVLGEVVPAESVVKRFSNSSLHPDLHYFYLELKSGPKKLVDVELNEIEIKESGKRISSKIRRISLGRYEIEIDQDNLDYKKLKFLVQKKSLKHQLVALRKPVKQHSSMKVLSNENNRLKVRLILKDKAGSMVEVQQFPEIVLEGTGEVSDMVMVKPGIWEIEIGYPEENVILYLSARANGVLLERLYRFQHVEK